MFFIHSDDAKSQVFLLYCFYMFCSELFFSGERKDYSFLDRETDFNNR